MRIPIRKYGDLLVSRPAGREAVAAMLAYLPPVAPDEPVELDFTGVLAVAPSWLDEVLTGLRERYGARVACLPSPNASLAASLDALAASYRTVTEQLARAHRRADSGIVRLLAAPDPQQREVRLVEVSTSAPATNAPLVVRFASSAEVPMPSAVLLLSPEEWAAIERRELDLPEGWDRLEEL